jgi:hypothetical protein
MGETTSHCFALAFGFENLHKFAILLFIFIQHFEHFPYALFNFEGANVFPLACGKYFVEESEREDA